MSGLEAFEIALIAEKPGRDMQDEVDDSDACTRLSALGARLLADVQ